MATTSIKYRGRPVVPSTDGITLLKLLDVYTDTLREQHIVLALTPELWEQLERELVPPQQREDSSEQG